MRPCQMCLIAAALLFLTTAPVLASSDHAPNEMIVKFKAGATETEINDINHLHDMTEVECHPVAMFRRLQALPPCDIHAMLAEYAAMPQVEYAELNYYVYAQAAVNDPWYIYQWDLWDPNAGVNVEQAWPVTLGSPSVVVAVVDTGIAYENYNSFIQAPDLAGTLFIPGYNYINSTTHANDDYAHGTHVTGTIAQTTNNGIGSAGIARNCSIMPVKVLDNTGSGTSSNLANGIYFAANNGAKVINISLGSTSASTTVQNALIYAYQHNVTVVCAAGNGYQTGDVTFYPAAYHNYCIAVGATRYDKTRAYYSNTGFYLDVVAPGGDTTVDQNLDGLPDGIYQQTFTTIGVPTSFSIEGWEGTSMATPHVSAIAALLYSHGINDPNRVKRAIQNTARDLGTAGWDSSYGWGLVDAATALTYFDVPGDFDRNGNIDNHDLLVITSHWLQNYPPADIAPAVPDGIINFLDFAVMARNWGLSH
jgi:serine protease